MIKVIRFQSDNKQTYESEKDALRADIAFISGKLEKIASNLKENPQAYSEAIVREMAYLVDTIRCAGELFLQDDEKETS